jgi:hypothetical protein
LKELCDDRLNQETNGTQESYGSGSFERCLTKLENQKLLERVYTGKKETTIISHINKIEYFLQREKLESSFSKVDPKIIEADVEDSILEEIIEEAYSLFLDRAVGLKYRHQPSESYYPIRKLVASAFANMISRAFDFNISYDPTKIQLNKGFIMEIAAPIFNIIKRNPETPFSINVGYKGLSASTSTEVISQYEPRISQLSVDCFLS